jgi:dTDP-glucose 4,6-dehydratase
MKILITGSEGFIGSHLTEKLISLGYDIRAFIKYNSFNSYGWLDVLPSKTKDKIDFFLGDIRDPSLVEEACKDCEAIFNLASLIAIPYSYKAPHSYLQTNALGALNIMNAAKNIHNIKVIHTSSSEVYGTAQYVPINETHPLNAQSPYAATKIAADQIVKAFNYSFEIPSIIIRPFNTYGPRQSLRAVVPTIISQLLNNNIKINLGSISPTRDLSFIEDTVSGFIAALNSNIVNGEVFNLGSNFEISIDDLANLIGNLFDKKIIINSEEKRVRPKKSEVERLWADITKAKKILKWEPKYENIEGLKSGLLKTINWFKNSKNVDFYKIKNFVL